MNQCFQNLVGITDTCNPPSGLSLKQIGITTKEVGDFINSDYESAEELIEDKIDLATKKVSDRITNHLSEFMRSSSVIESARLGFPQDNLQLVTGGDLRGIRIELKNETSFLDLFISSLSLQVNYTGQVSIYVFDLMQNKLIDTLSMNAVSGELSHLVVNKTYPSTRRKLNLAFVYDASSISSYKTYIKQGYCSTCTGSSYDAGINNYIKAGGIKVVSASVKTYENTTSIDNTAGMSLIYSLQCNPTEWLCSFSNLMAMPIAYKTAYNIMEYAVNVSKRLNSSTLIDEYLNVTLSVRITLNN
jgi:hypothetical protein